MLLIRSQEFKHRPNGRSFKSSKVNEQWKWQRKVHRLSPCKCCRRWVVERRFDSRSKITHLLCQQFGQLSECRDKQGKILTNYLDMTTYPRTDTRIPACTYRSFVLCSKHWWCSGCRTDSVYRWLFYRSGRNLYVEYVEIFSIWNDRKRRKID